MNNLEAEFELFAKVLENNNYLDNCEYLSPVMFTGVNQYIWEGILNLASANKVIATDSLWSEVRGKVDLKYLMTNLRFIPVNNSNFSEREIFNLYQKRKINEFLQFNISNSKNDDYYEYVEQLKDGLDGLIAVPEQSVIQLDKEINKTFDLTIEKSLLEYEDGFISTYFPSFNTLTSGLMAGNMFSIEGQKKSCKTTFANMLSIDFAINQNIPVAIFNHEMTTKEIIWKTISNIVGFNYNYFRNPKKFKDEIHYNFENYRKESLSIFNNTNINIIDKIMNEKEIFRMVKKLIRNKGVQYVLIDYIGLVNTESKFDTRERQVAYLSKFFKEMAKELNIVVCVLSQQNRQGEIAESLALRRDCDYAFSIAKTSTYTSLDFLSVAGVKEKVKGDENTYIIKLEDTRHTEHSGRCFLSKFFQNKFREYDYLHEQFNGIY